MGAVLIAVRFLGTNAKISDRRPEHKCERGQCVPDPAEYRAEKRGGGSLECSVGSCFMAGSTSRPQVEDSFQTHQPRRERKTQCIQHRAAAAPWRSPSAPWRIQGTASLERRDRATRGALPVAREPRPASCAQTAGLQMPPAQLVLLHGCAAQRLRSGTAAGDGCGRREDCMKNTKARKRNRAAAVACTDLQTGEESSHEARKDCPDDQQGTG